MKEDTKDELGGDLNDIDIYVCLSFIRCIFGI